MIIFFFYDSYCLVMNPTRSWLRFWRFTCARNRFFGYLSILRGRVIAWVDLFSSELRELNSAHFDTYKGSQNDEQTNFEPSFQLCVGLPMLGWSLGWSTQRKSSENHREKNPIVPGCTQCRSRILVTFQKFVTKIRVSPSAILSNDTKQYGTSKLRNPLTSVNTTSVQFNKSTEFEIMLISNNKY